MKLSIIIPTYNEESTIGRLIEWIEKTNIGIEKEVIIVDDGSYDKTPEILKSLEKKHIFILLTHSKNKGKGAAIQTALKEVSGDIVIIQDADLETNPDSYSKLIKPIINGKSNVVYGVRIRFFKKLSLSLKIYFLGGKFLTMLANFLFKCFLSDINTPCKLLETKTLKEIDIQSNGFDVDLEITAKILKRKHHLIEIPIPYFPREIKDGKKIRPKDGLAGAWALIKYRFKN